MADVAALYSARVTQGALARDPAQETVLPEFQRIWEEVCRDWSLRFGTKVRGWWVDGAYAPKERYPEDEPPNYATYAAALRAGNPDALIAFNTGVQVPVISATPAPPPDTSNKNEVVSPAMPNARACNSVSAVTSAVDNTSLVERESN